MAYLFIPSLTNRITDSRDPGYIDPPSAEDLKRQEEYLEYLEYQRQEQLDEIFT
jgi:hypothetical protein